jgi:hypothetical protein
MRNLEDEYNEDPELHDENDPEYQQEMFRIYQSLGWKPEDLHDREIRGEVRGVAEDGNGGMKQMRMSLRSSRCLWLWSVCLRQDISLSA